ncbi:MAG: AGE family epimerase/isomerase [Bacteroidota bacterium]
MIPHFLYCSIVAFVVCLMSCQPDPPTPLLKDELQEALTAQMMHKWFPAIVDDSYGGYLSNLGKAWEVGDKQDKMIVTQARHLWSAAQMGMRFPQDSRYQAATKTGFEFLRDQMWDEEYGGFYNDVKQNGEVLVDEKRAYGNAFGIFGLAAYYQLSQSEEALELAKQCFLWLDKHAHDPVHGGYYPFMDRAGTIIQVPPRGENSRRKSAIPFKDQNPTIHLLEAFTDLYVVWPDSLLRERLVEQLFIVRDLITHPDGYMRLYFLPNWEVVSFRDSSAEVREANYHLDHVTFGHDVETAYLMLEACEVLRELDCSATLSVGKKMLDHSLTWGFDQKKGGFYERGYYFAGESAPTIIDHRKNWWAQAEGLHTLLLFSQRFPEEESYRKAFDLQWQYIQQYLMDPVNGGWYSHGLDTEPESAHRGKANIWKGSYHNGRALMRCLDLLHANSSRFSPH